MHPYILAELYPKNRNLKARWLVQWAIWDVQKNKLVYEQKRVPGKLKTIREREKWAKEFIAEINKALLDGYVIDEVGEGTTVTEQAPANRKLMEVLNEMLLVKNFELKKKSRSGYKSILGKFKDFLAYENLGNINSHDFLPKHFFLFKDYLMKVLQNANPTINKTIFTIGHLFKMGVDRGHLKTNPFAGFKSLKEVETESNTAYTIEHQQAMEAYLKDNDLRLYYFTRFMYYGFIRPAELRQVKIKHVDLKRRTISVFGQDAKNSKIRIIRINPTLWQTIKEMDFEGLNPDLFVFGKKLLTTKFRQPDNEAYNKNRKALEALELMEHNYTLYSWRHTGAVNAITIGGLSVFELQRQFGHSDVKETQIYLKTLKVRIDNQPLENTW
ncbi:tyrosine-type recombinase/integrase [Runella sp.]|uniref:tyrosine-type recombinase/integrase n=1 Tax=Runella sp. TaxID=1960881 RepID=UPI003D12787A